MWSRIYPILKGTNAVRKSLSRAIGRVYYASYFHLHGFPYCRDWCIYGKPFLRAYPGSQLNIGRRLVLTSSMDANPIGVGQPVFLRVEANAQLQIGNDVGISGSTISVVKQIIIGSEVLIGSGVLIIDSDMHQLNPTRRRYSQDNINSAPIIIGDRVFIGARAIILKGVTVGEGSIIGAGSVVTSDIPPMCIAVGNPAHAVRNIAEFE